MGDTDLDPSLRRESRRVLDPVPEDKTVREKKVGRQVKEIVQ